MDEVTKFCFDQPAFNYDVYNGAPCYISGYTVWNFNLSLFIADIKKGSLPRTGCCYDGGAIVHTLSGLLGAQTSFVLTGAPYTSSYFGYLNCFDPIGLGDDLANNPFYLNGMARKDKMTYQDGTISTCKRTSFGNHGFCANIPGMMGVIWDGTLCADVDSNPDTFVLYPPAGGYKSTDLTADTLTDLNATWTPGEWVGMRLNPSTNKTFPNPYKDYEIIANTATEITVTAGSNMIQYAKVGNNYWINDPAKPLADMKYVTGVPWSLYKTMVVDNIPYSGTNPPVKKLLKVN